MSVPSDQMQGGLAAVNQGIQLADGETEGTQQEKDEVKRLKNEYTLAREFDIGARQQYGVDRRYAQGRADPNWASDANIIGSFIDILVSFLYARDPDVSVRRARRVNNPRLMPGLMQKTGLMSDEDMTMFADTLQLVISRLWKDAKLKKRIRKQLRSTLSVGVGWAKSLVYTEQRPCPQIEKELGSVQDNIQQIEGILKVLGDPSADPDREKELERLKNQQLGLQQQKERSVKRGQCYDIVRADDMQVSLDVADLTDHLEADFNSNDMYIVKDQALGRFPRLTATDMKTATIYHQRQTGIQDKATGSVRMPDAKVDEGVFVKSTDNPGLGNATMGGQKPVEFIKATELWDRRDNLIKTFIDGVEKWAVEPYAPPQASDRFYPYFLLALFVVDGSRHPQSLSWRMRKLQDEYSTKRSNGRLTTERSVPGTVFNRGALSPEDAKKLEDSVHLEMVGLNPTNPSADIRTIVTEKPLPRVDPLLFDTTPVVRDMQIVSGVQEAMAAQQTGGPKTATEADIQSQGFASRTGADRDTLEEMLTELAQYTAVLAIQSLTPEEAQRIAGPNAYWPVGMAVDDILTLVEVEIVAGTTGKPGAKADKETWATILPMVQSMMLQIQQLQLTNPALAEGYRNLLRETLRRLDDRFDIDTIMPVAAPMPTMGAPVPGAPGADPNAPPGAPAVGNGTVNNPVANPPPPVA